MKNLHQVKAAGFITTGGYLVDGDLVCPLAAMFDDKAIAISFADCHTIN